MVHQTSEITPCYNMFQSFLEMYNAVYCMIISQIGYACVIKQLAVLRVARQVNNSYQLKPGVYRRKWLMMISLGLGRA